MNEVHVWKACLELDGASYRSAYEILSPDEQQRASRFHFEQHRVRFAGAHAFLRQVLASYVECKPEDLAFQSGAHGKPFLTSTQAHGLEFNLSHSGSAALVAVSHDRPVGIDVEILRPLDDWMGIAEGHFSRCEFQQIAALPEADRHAAFFSCWTLKEAWIKATGMGLSFPLDGFDVRIGPGGGNRLMKVKGDSSLANEWWLSQLTADPGYAAAIAVRGDPIEIRIRSYEW